jgi:DnaJ-domain-containing protein 1
MQFLLAGRIGGMTRSEFFFYYSIPIIVVLVALLFAVRKSRKQDSVNYSDDFISAAVVLGSLLIFRENERSVSQKLHWIDGYLRRRFSNTAFNVVQIYQDVVRNGVDLAEYTDLVNQRLSERQKIHAMEFLVRLANTNGSVNSGESEFIFYLLQRFKIHLNKLDQVVQDILISRKNNFKTPSWQNRSHYFKVLGLKETADLKEIKSAYRKMVKIYHPDNHGEFDEQGKQTRVAKFLEIQQAYEMLIAELNSR